MIKKAEKNLIKRTIILLIPFVTAIILIHWVEKNIYFSNKFIIIFAIRILLIVLSAICGAKIKHKLNKELAEENSKKDN